ncbi:hypothetical protein JF66_16920 [Cryobacterium sp. MLB-32]|uniref:aminotransferase-like domain-containing protein n=1 Tax=Cryobacterium sp. MLB-32 TaxID=1529318 RepID=UPI0004E7BBA2|nr:aminotransferase class I/II-fold pyridoxal phosphate-dependent enzyme [Cryobacterium sp. MLB-32]KFF58666.1 hypothetical protein JF66_16920 [Cryobacterium sp. MLB-32]
MQIFIHGLEDRTPAAIAAHVGRLISSGRLPEGERLPTVRQLASALAVSPATISHAWQALASVGLIVSRGRSGTFVLGTAPRWLPARSRSMAGQSSEVRLDLSRGTPDPLLLPSLGPALSRLQEHAVTPSYLALPVIPELLAVLEHTWPYRAEAITVVDGALDAVSRSLDQITRFGDRVIVENPGFPPFFDLLDQLGIERLPVAIDEHGIVPADFQAALRRSPAAVILQPRAQNPTGASMPTARAAELARLLRTIPQASETIVIEDDHSGEISIAPDVSLGSWLPDRVLHVRSYSKTHGPDLRIAAVGGPGELIDAIVARRMLGPGWTSRMLQGILHDLLTAGDSMAQVSEARRIYFARQRALRLALAECGMEAPQADGMNAWLPVHDEREALVRLAAAGIRVAGGSPFLADEHSGEFIRVTAAALPTDFDFVAAALVQAALPPVRNTQAPGPRWA